MLEYKILSNKPTTTIRKNGKDYECVDLLAESYNKDRNISGRHIIVNEMYVARPDLISLAIYGTDKYADILCKVNGISNPFELNEDMLLFCPTTDMLTLLSNGKGSTSELIYDGDSTNINSNGTTNTNLLNKLSNSQKTIARTETSNKQLNTRRSPGEQTVNDKNYILDKSLGIVIY